MVRSVFPKIFILSVIPCFEFTDFVTLANRSDPTENDSVEGLRPNARGPGLVTFGVCVCVCFILKSLSDRCLVWGVHVLFIYCCSRTVSQNSVRKINYS